jgi:cardiolipin synthase
VLEYLQEITVVALLNALLIATVIPLVLLKKRDSTVAVAWCMVVFFLPLVGGLLYWVFGYNYLFRRVRGKSSHQASFKADHPPTSREATRGVSDPNNSEAVPSSLALLGLALNSFPISHGNQVTLYHETEHAFAGLLEAIRAAQHHIHLEFFILRSDATGERLIEVLTQKVREGVEVRLLYDSVGGLFLKRGMLRPLLQAGGSVYNFLPVNPLRSWVRVNLRNHRKIAVIDGQIGFTGGMNIGDEYLGKSKRFGYWRDNFLRLEGPAVAGLQRIFIEDWDFAAREPLNQPIYFPALPPAGEDTVQVMESGPDQEVNSIREMYFGAILSARERLWMASPYFVPDKGILDALRLARFRGVDVRLLCLMRPDHFLSFHASRYYWGDALAMGIKVYQYARGMMHCKLMMVDGQWAMAGSANLDNRSLHLNFEVGCMLHSPRLVADLEHRFEYDLSESIPLDRNLFTRRPFLGRLTDNACRLFSPIL